MKKFFGNILLIMVAVSQIKAQAPPTITSADIYLRLKKLNVLGSVLYIAAHPDDENTRLLAYLANDQLYRTGYLSLTRGDGGQNLIGNEQGIELGLIRTQELLAARRIDGAEQFFTRAFDFGFSKGPDETFRHWDKEKILSDVVWMIRKFQPDVIITRFPTTGEGGHGQHTASAILANEAFTAAADPKRFPEQLQYVQPWQAKRILWNTFNFGAMNTTSNDQFHFDVGGYNPVLGKSYGELAAESRSQHKSQGFGMLRSRGEAIEYFRTTGGTAPVNNLLDDITTTWQRVKGGTQITQLINSAIDSFDLLQPQKIVPQLVQIYQSLNVLPQSYWRDEKIKEVKTLVEAAGGLWIEAFTTEQYAVQGDYVKINMLLNDRLGMGVKVNGISIEKFDTTLNEKLTINQNFSLTKKLFVPDTKEITQPYWLKNKMEEGYYNVTDRQIIGQPDIQPAYTVIFNLNIGGENFSFTKPVKYKFSDPVKGEQYQPFVILPKLEVKYGSDNVLSINGAEVPVQVNCRTNRPDTIVYQINNIYSNNWTDNKKTFLYNTKQNNDSYVTNTMKPIKAGNSEETASLIGKDKKDNIYDSYRKEIVYNHIPTINYFPKATTHLVGVDLKTSGKKIGYIIGAGDKVPEALEQMGYEVTLLGDKELARNNLQQYDAVIAGVRAFNTDDWLGKYYEKLMQYVQEGGNYIVQYSQANNIHTKIGPYNFNVLSKRITDETAAVTFLQPQHPVLNFPNKITQDDFKGWIQERSIYHAGNLDPQYQTIFRMNDPGEQPDDGSLVIASYGKGFFTYTGLVFFRELPAGVPGAYRLLANIIALNHKKTM